LFYSDENDVIQLALMADPITYPAKFSRGSSCSGFTIAQPESDAFTVDNLLNEFQTLDATTECQITIDPPTWQPYNNLGPNNSSDVNNQPICKPNTIYHLQNCKLATYQLQISISDAAQGAIIVNEVNISNYQITGSGKSQTANGVVMYLTPLPGMYDPGYIEFSQIKSDCYPQVLSLIAPELNTSTYSFCKASKNPDAYTDYAVCDLNGNCISANLYVQNPSSYIIPTINETHQFEGSGGISWDWSNWIFDFVFFLTLIAAIIILVLLIYCGCKATSSINKSSSNSYDPEDEEFLRNQVQQPQQIMPTDGPSSSFFTKLNPLNLMKNKPEDQVTLTNQIDHEFDSMLPDEIQDPDKKKNN